VIEIQEFVDTNNRSYFARWFRKLNPIAASKVTTALVRLGKGNLSNSKSIGGGVFECCIDFGPGYRVYFGREGDDLVILLGGGSKKKATARH